MRRTGLTLLGAACVALAGCNGGTVDRHALTKDAEAVDSLACEGRLLAHDVAEGRSTATFVRVHAGDLGRRASNFEDALSTRGTVAGIERDVRALARKAGRVASLLEELEESPGGSERAADLEERLANEGDCR